MPDESLIAAAEPDRFTHESPIRAFTDFRVSGTWAIGKGFRPSLAHLHTYLDAMQNKEGWQLVQMLDGGTLNPTMLFQRDRIMSFTVPDKPDIYKEFALTLRPKVTTLADVDAWLRGMGFALIQSPDGSIRYEPEQHVDDLKRVIAANPALGAPYNPSAIPEWTQHASDAAIPDVYWCEAAEFVIRRVMPESATAKDVDALIRDFTKRFRPRPNITQTTHVSLFSQLEFVLPNKTNKIRIKQMIDEFRISKQPEAWPGANEDLDEQEAFQQTRVPNVGDDPINPAYYDGTACAEIIEHMPTNVGITAKYIWRLGEKDAEKQECGKAAWYLQRELALLDESVDHGHGRAKFGFASPNDCAWFRRYADERINAAQKGGKLTTWRATAMSALVSYTITGEPSFLHTVIGYLEGSECFNEYGRGQEP